MGRKLTFPLYFFIIPFSYALPLNLWQLNDKKYNEANWSIFVPFRNEETCL